MSAAWDDEPAWPADAIEVAKVIDAFGIKGWLRVQPYAAQPEALFSSRRWFLQPPAGRPRPAGAPALPKVLRITQAQEHGDGVVASAQEVLDRNAAEALKGARIFVSRTSFPSTDDGEYYWIDLIGLEVLNRQGERLGTVIDLLDTGPHCVLRIKPAPGAEAADGDEGPERMVPFVKAYVDEVDMTARRILVDWGLDY
ncbi:MAG: ribosome maturation factor RimM [Burkholderiales bacterium]